MMIVEINTVEKTIVIEEATAKELIELLTKYNNFKVVSKIVEVQIVSQPYITTYPHSSGTYVNSDFYDNTTTDINHPLNQYVTLTSN